MSELPDSDDGVTMYSIEEIKRLQSVEVERDLLKGENDELRAELTKVRWDFASLKESLEGMADDMGQMEATIHELSNRTPGDYDGP